MVAPPSDSELRDALEPVLRDAGIEAPREIRRRPSEYRTSFPLEELELVLEGGATLHLVFKRLDWDALTAPPQAVARFGELAREAATPISDQRGTAEFRRHAALRCL